jgi:hypothetical protein
MSLVERTAGNRLNQIEVAKPLDLICPDPTGKIAKYVYDNRNAGLDENIAPSWSHELNLYEYQRTLNDVYPFTFAEFLKKYRQSHEGKRTTILDFMGFGKFFREMDSLEDLQGGISFSYGYPTDVDSYYSGNRKIQVTHAKGNMVTEEAWVNIQKAINRVGAQKIGLLVAIPNGGYDEMPHDTVLFSEIFRRMHGLLAKDGMMLIQVPWWIEEGFTELVDAINSNRPAYVDQRIPPPAKLVSNLRIIKYASWLQELPNFKFLTIYDVIKREDEAAILKNQNF